MIAIPTNKPLLQTGSCVISCYDEEWISDVLQKAADKAGVSLPFRKEIAKAVLLYLEQECPLRTLPLEFLFQRMQDMLRDIGLPRIAAHLHKQTPPIDIELDALADESPLPLFFYTELRRKMDSLRDLGLTTYHFSGRKACSLALGSRRRSCPTQRAALRELDSFLTSLAS